MKPLDRREFLTRVATGTSAVAAVGVPDLLVGRGLESRQAAGVAQATHGKGSAGPVVRGGGLADPTFRPLPLGAVRARGWLERQLRIQAAGLTGHLDEFWPDVAQSQWFGGDAEGWERAPYWLDGAIPLAWILDDEGLKAKVGARVEEILRRQEADGTYGPMAAAPSGKPYDVWAIFLVNKALAQHHEATGDERTLRAIQASLASLRASIAETPLFNWGKYRWFEGLIPTYYVYERTAQPWLLDLARALRRQGQDYPAVYADRGIAEPTPRRGLWTWDKHGVNQAMAPKAAALSWRLDQRSEDRAFPAHMLEILDRWHGQATGMFAADECLAGKDPVQGTELCAVVEMMYSMEVLLSVFGDAAFGDRLERVAFNALPAAMKPDMWAHQYDQQVNQVQCTINPDYMWSTNGADANVFGLAPEYGCCTSNLHQGWPKLTAHLWMKTADEGLAAVAYAPSEATFRSGDVAVSVTLDTDYPFRDTLSITVAPERAVRFPLVLRVPGWAEGASVRVADGPPATMHPGTFHRVERAWSGPTHVTVHLPMRTVVSRRYHGALAVERGPLVYGLRIEEEWKRVRADAPHRELPHGDFEVRPASAWNYGLIVDPERPDAGLRFEERPVGDTPFSLDGAGVLARGRGRKLSGWKLDHGWAAEVTPGRQGSSEPVEEIVLLPYGCTDLRVTEFPETEG